MAEKIPGNLRRPEHLLSVLRKLVVYFKSLLMTKELQVLSPLLLVGQLHEKYFVEQRTLKFVQKRLHVMFNTLKVDTAEYHALNLIAGFATVLSTYFKGMSVLIEPSPPESNQSDPVVQLFCHDASLCLKSVFSKF